MNKVVSTATLLALASLAAAEDIDRTLDAASDGEVHVSNIAGSVSIEAWSRDAVQVTGTLGRNVKELIFERNGDEVLIKVKVPRHGGRGINSDLDIKVPAASSLDVGTVSADIEVTDVGGEQSLHSVSGDIETEHRGAEIDAETVSGDIEVRGDDSAGEVHASVVSGDVALFRVSGEVSAAAVSGDVRVEDGTFRRGDFSTVNGEIEFLGTLGRNGRLDFETVNGSVDIELVGDVSADVDIDTLNGGISNCFGPEARRTSKYGPGWELRFTEGDGDGRIDIESVNGGVSLCKR